MYSFFPDCLGGMYLPLVLLWASSRLHRWCLRLSLLSGENAPLVDREREREGGGADVVTHRSGTAFCAFTYLSTPRCIHVWLSVLLVT